MPAAMQLAPIQSRYQCKGAVVELEDLLLQRYAARSLEYVAHTRSIAGISGLHLSKMRGRGIDFEEFRPYQQGDDIRLIDWRVTARTSRPFTKVFREERERPVIVAVDQTSNMFFGSQVAFKSVIAAQVAALFCWLAIDNGDRVGGLVYSDKNANLVRPRRSRRSALHLLNLVYQYNQRLQDHSDSDETPLDPGFEPGLAYALGQIRRITKPGSTLYIVSDFATLDERALQYLYQLSRHNNVICVFISDPLEEVLPLPGYYSITDGRRRGALNTFNGRIRERYEEQFRERMESITSELDQLQVPMIRLKTNQPTVEQIRQWIVQNS
ncbi:MAG: DUF58 domain-containing protein [Gammaproteobacteria bacterium]|nr:DUF58 domain-containing protein [Pseudomonadales bacterium]MCP5346076.1 DUF58 domain-containing protein [Pseudomonadales bacterium]